MPLLRALSCRCFLNLLTRLVFGALFIPLLVKTLFFSRPHNVYTRINFFLLASKPLLNSAASADIGIRQLSDHSWVSCIFSLKPSDGKGPNWLLDKFLLSDPLTCDNIHNEIKDYFTHNANCGVSPDIVWDTFKAFVWGHFISVPIACRKMKEKATTELKAKIAYLEAKHMHSRGNKTLPKLTLEQKKLALYETSQAQRNLLFLQQRYLARTPQFL